MGRYGYVQAPRVGPTSNSTQTIQRIHFVHNNCPMCPVENHFIRTSVCVWSIYTIVGPGFAIKNSEQKIERIDEALSEFLMGALQD